MKRMLLVISLLIGGMISLFSDSIFSQKGLSDRSQYFNRRNELVQDHELDLIKQNLMRQVLAQNKDYFLQNGVIFLEGMSYTHVKKVEKDVTYLSTNIRSEFEKIKKEISDDNNYADKDRDKDIKKALNEKMDKLIQSLDYVSFYRIEGGQFNKFTPKKLNNGMYIIEKGQSETGYAIGFDIKSIYKQRSIELPDFMKDRSLELKKFVVSKYDDSMYKDEIQNRKNYGETCSVCPRDYRTCNSCEYKDNECVCNCNYCSSIGQKLDKIYGRIFSMPCGRHDCCYSYGSKTYNKDSRGIKRAGDCDFIFGLELIEMCYARYTGADLIGCVVTSDLMYTAVNNPIVHALHYKDNAKQCECEYLKINN